MKTILKNEYKTITVDRCKENPNGTKYAVSRVIEYKDGKPCRELLYKT